MAAAIDRCWPQCGRGPEFETSTILALNDEGQQWAHEHCCDFHVCLCIGNAVQKKIDKLPDSRGTIRLCTGVTLNIVFK